MSQLLVDYLDKGCWVGLLDGEGNEPTGASYKRQPLTAGYTAFTARETWDAIRGWGLYSESTGGLQLYRKSFSRPYHLMTGDTLNVALDLA